VLQLKIWHFWDIGIERNVCRCTFNRHSIITQFAKLAAVEQLCRRCTHRKLQHFKTFKRFSWKITNFELWHCCRKLAIVVIYAKDLCLKRSKQVAFHWHCYGTVPAAPSVTGHTWNAELHHALRNITDNWLPSRFTVRKRCQYDNMNESTNEARQTFDPEGDKALFP